MQPPDDDTLVECPRCREKVVTVELRTVGSVFWRCVRCGYIFVQRLADPGPPPAKR